MGKKSDKVFAVIDSGIFNAMILFSCGFSYNELMKHLKSQDCQDWALAIKDDKDTMADGDHWALKRIVKEGKATYTYFYIFFRHQFDFSDHSMVVLAHECLHICQFLLPEFLDRDREVECEAYLHSHLMMQCLNVLRGK